MASLSVSNDDDVPVSTLGLLIHSMGGSDEHVRVGSSATVQDLRNAIDSSCPTGVFA
eukprot:CAMPEP_0185907222 /NCGR_PEP_ID=MMETSP0196C-20130402/6658_1 /TAXON_ID=2932 /ORGANISM="Alexandrium fundyense, Strain CCMP1719" /LENGTH=56 /DNA_ID=CAMNT_0028627143 /DNA_START=178 /DNA_END=344 /DNA_ORIENTATION=+